MEKRGNIVRYSAEELARMPSETDWAKVRATTAEEIERQADEDDGPLPLGWEDTVVIGAPGPGRGVYLRIDPDVLDWIKETGEDYQAKINKILRDFVESHKSAA